MSYEGGTWLVIYGVGTDIVRIARMETALARHNVRLAERLLTNAELEEFSRHPRPARFLAKRFAAKEAAAKALGMGFRGGLTPRDIGVGHDSQGRPTLEFSVRGDALRRELGAGVAHLTLADEDDYAVAFVVVLTVST